MTGASAPASHHPDRGADGAALDRWGALGILMTLAFLNYMDRKLLPPVLSLLQADLGLSPTQLGGLQTGFQLVYMAAAPLVGVVADRLSRKSILLVAVVSWSVVTALSGTATGFLSLLLWRSLTGLGEGGYFPTAVSLIGDLFAPGRRGLALALHGICTTLGGSAGNIVGGQLGDRWGWRAPFFLAVVPGLALSVVMALRFREPRRGAIDEGPAAVVGAPPGAVRPYLAIVLSPPILLIALAAAAANFAMTGLNDFIPYYLNKARGVSVRTAGTLSGLLFGATMIGQLAGGLLSDRLAARVRGARPLLVALPYLALAPALSAIPRVAPLGVALACYGLTQVGRGFAEPNIYATVIDAMPASERGTSQGFLLALTFAGGSASTLVTGWVIEHRGYQAALDLLGGAAAVAGLLAVGLVAHLRQRRAA